jgi:hypothetical protein
MTVFRKWRYGPNGEAGLFENEADVPKGWKDCPPADKDNVENARRQLDIPHGRMDRQALPTQLGVIAEQIFTEVSAKVGGPPTADERPTYGPPSSQPDRWGEREGPKVIDDPVRDQGDKQPHIEAHNWTPVDQAKMMAREAKAAEEAIANRPANQEVDSPAIKKLEQAFEPAEVEAPTVDEVRADPEILTDEQKEAVAEAEKEGLNPLGDPLDHDESGKKGGSKAGAASTASKGKAAKG